MFATLDRCGGHELVHSLAERRLPGSIVLGFHGQPRLMLTPWTRRTAGDLTPPCG
jgi:hypothetical protein